MSQYDDLWDDLVESNVLNFDQMGRARARFIEASGGICTAIIETIALEESTLEKVISCIASTLGYDVAPTEWLDAPDLEALARIPRSVLMEYGILPALRDDGAQVLVTPAHAPHMLARLREEVEYDGPLYIGLEVDLRHALQRFTHLEPSERFHALWMGNCPSALRSGEMAVWSALSGQQAQSPGVCGVTRPGRPRALGMADTDELRANLMASHWNDGTNAGFDQPNDTEGPLEHAATDTEMLPFRSEAETAPP